MTMVLLKRDLRTPWGRFDRSVDGVPTKIPQAVIDRLALRCEAKDKEGNVLTGEDRAEFLEANPAFGLPRDTVIVGDDYQTPAEVAEETLSDHDVGMTSAEQEAEISRRVNETLDKRKADKADDDKADDDDSDGDDDILDQSVPDIIPQLADFNKAELEDMLARENAGKTRTSLVVEIEAAIEDCE